MCTLSFCPIEGGFILTSNRDEQVGRDTISPSIHSLGDRDVIMPTDAVAGGTWIGASSTLTVCILNGGFISHNKTDFPEVTSRGKIVRRLFEVEDASLYANNLDCSQYEPFTLVIIDYSPTIIISELVWDGVKKHFRKLGGTRALLWSSSTLYNPEIKAIRQIIFYRSLSEGVINTQEEIFQFHYSQPLGSDQGFRIKRNNGIETVSISQVVVRSNKVEFTYFDLKNNNSEVQWVLIE